jgi:hypothetical protein
VQSTWTSSIAHTLLFRAHSASPCSDAEVAEEIHSVESQADDDELGSAVESHAGDEHAGDEGWCDFEGEDSNGLDVVDLGHATLDDFDRSRLPELLSKTGWAMMTAENPMGVQVTREDNETLQAQLKADLDARGLEYHVAEGHYGQKENSLLVLGIGELDAMVLGTCFRQDSVLTRRGLLFHDGWVVPATGVDVYEHRPEDLYTFLPVTNALFQVGLDSQRFRPHAR